MLETGNTAVLAFKRFTDDGELLCLFNLSDNQQTIDNISDQTMLNLLSRSGERYQAGELTTLDPFAAFWLTKTAAT